MSTMAGERGSATLMAYTFPDEEMGISLRQTRGRAGGQIHDPARSLKGWAAMIRKVYEVDPMELFSFRWT
jgi:hypothetical protein